MTRILIRLIAAACGVAALGCAPSPRVVSAPRPVRVDTLYQTETVLAGVPIADESVLRAGRFDNGKMWTFEYPPLDYFRETYGFTPDSAWLRHARTAALRLPNCTASFVSPRGLVLTNHHCARESASKVTRPGENLLDDGFYAATPADERAVEGVYADQLLTIEDVTAEVDAVPAAEREAVLERIRGRLASRYRDGDSVLVEIVSLWNGAKTSAYVFRRFTDLRLVMVPELQLGYFGGDPDNFTYPRYALDMGFYRVYGPEGTPYEPEFHFRWSGQGVREGDAVFVIGNPGSTSRLETVAQLEFRRAVSEKATLDFITSRSRALQTFADSFPEEAARLDLRNVIFSLENSAKAYRGMWQGLHDPVVLARRRDAERRFRTAIESDAALMARYAGVFDSLAGIQRRKAEFAAELGAFLGLGNPRYSAATLRRALFAYQYLTARAGGVPPSALGGLQERFRAVGEQPDALERQLLAARLEDLRRYLGDTSAVVVEILAGRTAFAAAAAIVAGSVLSDSARAVGGLGAGTVSQDDPAVRMIAAMLPSVAAYQGAFADLAEREDSLMTLVGRARFGLYGTSEPPDATFSLRIADGVVQGYEYNGTVAPVYTTFYGLYDHYHSYGPDSDWDLPRRWLDPPASFALSTPLNFVATADIIGGNSGSPVVNIQLELVGVAFDGNIESLPGDYIYLPDRNRAISVDARGMVAALKAIYGADRLVAELRGAAGR